MKSVKVITVAESRALEQAADQGPHDDEQPDCQEGDHVQGAEVGQNADRAGEGRQRTGVAVEDRGADAVKAGADGEQPDRQECGLNPQPVWL